MSGTFSQAEKVNFAVKSLLQLTTKYGTMAASDEAVALPRIFPISIRKDDIIKNGVGDLERTIVDTSAPWSTVQNYKIIDPKVDKVSNITVGNILTANDKSGHMTFSTTSGVLRTFTTNANWSQNNYYAHWYASETPSWGAYYPADAPTISSYKGLRLAYAKAASGSKPATDNIVPHISLYLHLELTQLEGLGMSNDENDTIAYYRKDHLTRNMLGPEVGFDIKLLANSTTTYSTSTEGGEQTGIIPKNDVINNSTFGAITLFSNLDSKYGTGAKKPRLSFCRYIGESVDFSSIGGASVTVEPNAPAVGDSETKGDLFYNSDAEELKINIASTGTPANWKGVGGGGSSVNETNNVTGAYSFAAGYNNATSANYAVVMGISNKTESSYSVAIGMENMVGSTNGNDIGGVALGYRAYAGGAGGVGNGKSKNIGFAVGVLDVTGWGGAAGTAPATTATSNNNKLVMLNDGNVGIGTDTPGYKLEVDGTVKAIAFKGNLDGNANTATGVFVSLNIQTSKHYLTMVLGDNNQSIKRISTLYYKHDNTKTLTVGNGCLFSNSTTNAYFSNSLSNTTSNYALRQSGHFATYLKKRRTS